MRKIQTKRETFVTPMLYKFVRHPMMTGVLIALWSVPVMTVGRFTFNALMTAYVFIGMHFEEKTLEDELGSEYRAYKETTPAVMPSFSPSSDNNSKIDVQ